MQCQREEKICNEEVKRGMCMRKFLNHSITSGMIEAPNIGNRRLRWQKEIQS